MIAIGIRLRFDEYKGRQYAPAILFAVLFVTINITGIRLVYSLYKCSSSKEMSTLWKMNSSIFLIQKAD